ncbi:MAG: sensor histidine kinase [Myxococcaceae bacterium]
MLSLRGKLIAIVLGVALIPLAISALSTLHLHGRGFEARITDLHRKTAELGAAFGDRYVGDVVRTLRASSEAIRWGELSEPERRGALWLVYREVDEIAAASLLDEEGNGLGHSVFVGEGDELAELARHPRASLPLLRAFASRLPLSLAREQGMAMGEAFLAPGTGAPMLPLLVRVQGRGGRPWYLAVALSLESLCTQLSQMTPAGLSAHLTDPRLRPVCAAAAPMSAPQLAARPKPLAPGDAEVLTVTGPSGEQVLVSVAVAPGGFALISEQPVAAAFALGRALRDQALLWFCLSALLSLGAGLSLATYINRPVKELVEGAVQLERGEFGHRLPEGSQDELGGLSRAFNRMGAEIQRRDAEIRAWNDQLQRRVDERTAELRETQGQLMRSQRIAALSGLGAGMAHEINNPLAGVLGLTQVLLAATAKRPGATRERGLLTMLEREARRIRDIVKTLQSLTEVSSAQDFEPVDVHQVLERALRQMEEPLAASRIEVRREFADLLPPVRGDLAQLQEGF